MTFSKRLYQKADKLIGKDFVRSWVTYPDEDVLKRFSLFGMLAPIHKRSLFGLGLMIHEKHELKCITSFKRDPYSHTLECHERAVSAETTFYQKLARTKRRRFSNSILDEAAIHYLNCQYPNSWDTPHCRQMSPNLEAAVSFIKTLDFTSADVLLEEP